MLNYIRIKGVLDIFKNRIIDNLLALNNSFLQNFIGRTRWVSRIIEQLTQGMIDFVTHCFKYILSKEVYFF